MARFSGRFRVSAIGHPPALGHEEFGEFRMTALSAPAPARLVWLV
jgi:hypothetical protein